MLWGPLVSSPFRILGNVPGARRPSGCIWRTQLGSKGGWNGREALAWHKRFELVSGARVQAKASWWTLVEIKWGVSPRP